MPRSTCPNNSAPAFEVNACSHVLDHALTQRTDGGSVAHGEFILSEVDDTSILRTGLSNGYRDPLD